MKLRNKKTGEIRKARIIGEHLQLWEEVLNDWVDYDDLDYLAHYWERYEEPKDYWYLNCDGNVIRAVYKSDDLKRSLIAIGNYFETPEEAELAVRKLEAWKLLKDLGFKIEGIRYRNNKSYIEWSISQKVRDDHFTSEGFNDCLHFLFGGEE